LCEGIPGLLGNLQEGQVEEHFIDCLERIVLDCLCGEKLILLGKEGDWRSRNAIFGCYRGQHLTLDNRIDEEALKIKELVRNLRTNHG
jgi:hypothetical protein